MISRKNHILDTINIGILCLNFDEEKKFTLIISDFLLRWIASFSVIQAPVAA